jgi:hypothetical protein
VVEISLPRPFSFPTKSRYTKTMPVQLDNASETQVITPNAKSTRTIYDATMGEIFWKSLVAGFALGIGKTISSLIFYVVVFSLFVTFLSPFISQMMEPINRLIPILEQSTKQQQTIQDQFRGVFSGLNPGEKVVETETTVTETEIAPNTTP